MADYGAIRDAIADRLELVTATEFLTVHSTVPAAVVAPAAVVVPGNPFAEYHESMAGNGGSLTLFRFDVVAMLQAAAEPFVQADLDALVSGAGSVPAVLEADQTLGGTADAVQVTQATRYGAVQFSDTDFVGCTFNVEIYSR